MLQSWLRESLDWLVGSRSVSQSVSVDLAWVADLRELNQLESVLTHSPEARLNLANNFSA